MGRLAAIVALTALLGAVPAQAADANLQTDTWDAEAPIDAMALAPWAGWFVMGTRDETPTFGGDIDHDQPTWFLWEHTRPVNGPSHWDQRRAGTNDAQGCFQGPVTTNCIGHAVDVAVEWEADTFNSLGYVIGANRDPADGSGALKGALEFHESEGGPKGVVALEGQVNAVAISGNGKYVVVGTTEPATGPGGAVSGQVAMYDFAGTQSRWAFQTDDPVLDVAIDVDAQGKVRVLAAADETYAFDLTGTEYVDVQGIPATGVAISHVTGQWALSSLEGGHINLYGPDSQGEFKRRSNDQRETNDATAIDIAQDGRTYVSGSSDGTLRLFNNKFLDQSRPGLLASLELVSPIADAKFSQDGRYLVVAAGADVYLYRVGNGLTQYWMDTLDGTVRHVAISGEGNTVLAAVGDSVHRYERKDALSITGPKDPVSIEPEGLEQAALQFVNNGNRDLTLALTASGPTDWGYTFDTPSFNLAPGQQRNIALQLAAVEGHPAGDEIVKVTATTSLGAFVLDVPIRVLQDRVWNLETNATNIGIEAGGSGQFTVQVKNEGNAEDETTMVATIDKTAWSVAVSPKTVRLQPGESTAVTVTVTSPANAVELETGTITLKPLANPGIQATLTATVGAHFGLTLAGAITEHLHAGESSDFELTLTNNGNAPDTVKIKSEGLPKRWGIAFPDGSEPYTVFALQPGASIQIPVTLTPDAAAEPANYQFRIRATSLGDSAQSDVVTFTIGVEEEPAETQTKDNGSPSAPLVLLMAGLLAVAARRRLRP